MSVTQAHAPQVAAPWLPIVVVLAIAAVALLVMALVVWPPETTPSATGAQSLTTAGTPAATPGEPKNKSAAFRAVWTGGAAAAALEEVSVTSRKYCRAPWAASETVRRSR